MKKGIWIAGLLCLVLGITLFSVGISMDAGKLNFGTLNKSFSQKVTALSIDCRGQDVLIRPSKDRNCYVTCSDYSDVSYTVELTNGVLSVIAEGSMFDGLFRWGDAKVTVQLPPDYFQGLYDSLEVSTGSGDILVEEGVIFQRSKLESTSGDISFRADVQGKMTIETTSGDIELEDRSSLFAHQVELATTSGEITVRGQNARYLSAKSTSGDVTLDSCDIHELTVNCTSGDVELRYVDLENCNLQTISGDVSAGVGKAMDFHCSSTSGDVDTPPPVTNGGLCQVSTTSGDIEIWIYSENDPERANRK